MSRDNARLRLRGRLLLCGRSPGALGHVGWQWIGRGLFIPENAQYPPALAVIEELHAVDAPCEWLSVGRRVPRFIAAEDLRNISETLNLVDDGGLKETIREEIFARELDVFVGSEQANRDWIGGPGVG
jgi:hypothetical protein